MPVPFVDTGQLKHSSRKRRKLIHRDGYRLYNPQWHAPLVDEWTRLKAAAKARGSSRDTRKRLEWIIWYKTTGNRNARATCRHFGIAPKVFYFWKHRFDAQNLAGLEDRSHRPHRARHCTLSGTQVERIAALRREYIHYSKMKLAVLYRERYGETMSSWHIQHVIQMLDLYPNPKRAENTARKRRRSVAKKRITELLKQPQTGFLFGIDTIVLHWEQKRYIFTAIDRHSRLAYARMYTTASSLNAADFLRRLHVVFGGNMAHIQTDNGSEFHKHFEKAVEDLNLGHWWSRVKTPKDNAICERFNRAAGGIHQPGQCLCRSCRLQRKTHGMAYRVRLSTSSRSPRVPATG